MGLLSLADNESSGHEKDGENNGGSGKSIAGPSFLAGLSLASVTGGGSSDDAEKLKEEKKRTEAERQKNVALQRKLEQMQEELMRTQE